MCELLGISSSVRIRPGRYFAAFRKRGRELPEGKGNPDGWGIALYPDRKAVQLIKEAIPAATSKLCEFVSSYEHMRSRTFIAHVRKASRGIVTYRNTHPFCREAMGREYSFAHNGTVRLSRKFLSGRYRPVGGTDSERLFCYILDYIEDRGICDWGEADLLDFWKFLIGHNRRIIDDQTKPSKLNMLLTGGDTLICYTDLYGQGTLHKLMLPAREEVLGGSNSSDCLQLQKRTEKSICVVATRHLLNDKRWVSMKAGELCALRNGVVVFSSGKAGAP